MSKIGKKIIVIPEGVELKHNGASLEFKGKGGTVIVNILPFIEAKIENGTLAFSLKEENIQAKANWGTIRAISQNAVIGVSEGFKKLLEVIGVGFRANMEGQDLVLSVGFSHPVRFTTPEGVKIIAEKNIVTVSGTDKYKVGEAAAKIRAIRKPEPYKGTGIKYKDEVIRRKAGKKVAGATGAA